MRENGVFFTPVKYTCLSRAPGFLGRTTHYRVSSIKLYQINLFDVAALNCRVARVLGF